MDKKYDMLTGLASVIDDDMLQNRLNKVKLYMEMKAVDILLVCDIQKEGYFRWLSGERCCGNPDQEIMLISREGKLYKGMDEAAEIYINNPWKVFGVVHMDKLRQEVYEYWNSIDTDFCWKDCTEDVRKIIVTKTPDEIAIMRCVQNMQHDVYHKLKEYIRPGLYEKDIVSFARYTADILGGGGIDKRMTAQIFMECLTDNEEKFFWPGRKIKPNDIYSIQLRLAGDGGYYGEISRCFFLGEADIEIKKGYDTIKNIQKEISCILKKEKSLHNLEKIIKNKTADNSVEVEVRGIGYTPVEGPCKIYGFQTLKIEEGMTVVILVKKRLNNEREIKISDVYEIKKEGIEKLIEKE